MESPGKVLKFFVIKTVGTLLGSQPTDDICHEPNSRLPLFIAIPATGHPCPLAVSELHCSVADVCVC